ncbi:hypothetical protein EG68_03278 [Paragonimus skrjabini miyazakii]|uniref:Cytochrome b561 domain-containing protein n=1 Tax=Paragonimus skrjabini miyazakii TaxID=59628 RepID=A0A8S9YWL1_9TREM|nr:hypothetical protein EG68_03278 [Paragonimus skrjabini miyazakii]
MLFAWGFCCPNGLLAARHFKTAWPGVLFALVVLAFMIMLVNLTGYSTLSTLPYSAHPLLGFIAFFLAFSNLFFAWMLITSTGGRRSLFRNFHLCVGLLAHALSVPLILTGFQMPKMGNQMCSSKAYSGTYLISLIFYAIVEVVLEVLGYKILFKMKSSCAIFHLFTVTELREKLQPFGLDAELVIQRIAQNPRHKKQQIMELLSNKDIEEKEFMQNSFKQIQTLRVIKYFLYAIHLMVSFSITFVLVIMVANL